MNRCGFSFYWSSLSEWLTLYIRENSSKVNMKTILHELPTCLHIFDAEVLKHLFSATKKKKKNKTAMLIVQYNKHNLFLGKVQACLLPIMKALGSLSSDSSSSVRVQASTWAHQQYPHRTWGKGGLEQLCKCSCFQAVLSNKCLYLLHGRLMPFQDP